jgi:hypothetical protein
LRRSKLHAPSVRHIHAELDRCAGKHFDPEVVAAFRRVAREEWEELRNRSSDTVGSEDEDNSRKDAKPQRRASTLRFAAWRLCVKLLLWRTGRVQGLKSEQTRRSAAYCFSASRVLKSEL